MALGLVRGEGLAVYRFRSFTNSAAFWVAAPSVTVPASGALARPRDVPLAPNLAGDLPPAGLYWPAGQERHLS
jgi:hypothetical protein